jgi:KaiC/GvpD/RAD55 family RecA-like ATPase
VGKARAAQQVRESDSASRRRAALFEVSLGRQCAMACAVAWIDLALLALYFGWQERSFSDPAGFFPVFAFLVPLGPALAGLAVSGSALMTKRGQLLGGHLKEGHNLAMVAGVAVSALVLVLALGIQAGSLQQEVGPYTAPLGVAGVSLGLLGYLLTWGGWSPRKVLAVLCALIPAILSAFHILRIGDQRLTIQLTAWEYTISGGFFLLAAVVFLVSMSATSAAEREIVRGADARIGAEYARLKARKKELDSAVAKAADRAAELEEDAAEVEARRREGDDYALQAQRLKDEAAQVYDRARAAEAAASAQAAEVAGKLAAAELKVQELAATAARRRDEEGSLVELRQATIQQKAAAEAERRKVDAERQAAAEQLAHAKREREAARATLQAAEERGRAIEAERQAARDLRRQAEEMKQVADARSSAVDSERLAALDAVQGKLAAERQALEKERAGLSDERAVVAREAAGLAEREAAVALRAKEMETLEASMGDAFAKLAKEKAEAEALRRQADAAMGDASARSKSATDSVAQLAAREEAARRAAESLRSQEARVAAREARLKQVEAEFAAKQQEVAQQRKAIAGERERITADAARLKEREEAIFQFEKHPDFAREAAAALADDLAIGAPAGPPAKRAAGVRDAPAPPAAKPAGRPPDASVRAGRLSFGNARFNELTGGGLPEGASVLIVGPAFCGKEAIPLGFIAAGIAAEQPAIVVTTVKGPAEIVEELAFIAGSGGRKAVEARTWFVDCSNKGQRGDLARDHVIDVGSPADFAKIKEAIGVHFKAVQAQGHGGFHFAYLPLTESWRLAEPNVARNFVQQMVAAVRRQGGGAVWVAESGIHSADEIESLAGMMQGVVRCQEERDGHALRVQGIEGVRSHQWVRYRHTPKGIDLGSFELERIR